MGSVVIIKYSLPLRSFHSVGPGIKTMTRDGVRPPEERETILWACEGGFESISQDGLYSGRRVLRDISYILEKKKATGHNNFIPPIPPTPPKSARLPVSVRTVCLSVCGPPHVLTALSTCQAYFYRFARPPASLIFPLTCLMAPQSPKTERGLWTSDP